MAPSALDTRQMLEDARGVSKREVAPTGSYLLHLAMPLILTSFFTDADGVGMWVSSPDWDRECKAFIHLKTLHLRPNVQPPPVTTTGHLGVCEQAKALIRSSLGSSTSSTLSFLFGKRSFPSALVISGLCCGGGNTSDTQSSSSVNIVMGPSARAASQATRSLWKRGSEPWEPTDATSRGSFVTDVWRRLWQRLSGLSAGEQARRTWAWTTRPRSRVCRTSSDGRAAGRGGRVPHRSHLHGSPSCSPNHNQPTLRSMRGSSCGKGELFQNTDLISGF
ncbi:hypothetical protein H8959_017337 [Pygathrix nigripes]